jgi:nicotinate-nucleotide adenylyltransferase
LIPCNIPALKPGSSALAQQRLEMLQCWKASLDLEDSDRLVIDATEIERAGTSYTVDTVETLQRQFPDDQLIFVTGADAWNSLPKWHRVDDLNKAVSFWVFSRKGDAPIQKSENHHQCRSLDELFCTGPTSYWIDDRVQKEVASSNIRRNAQVASELLPPAISNYINERGLYASTNELTK